MQLTIIGHARGVRVFAFLIIWAVSGGVISACSSGMGASDYQFQPQPGQGQYIQPDWLRPAPTPRLPALDPCRSQLYASLLGVNEGSIYIPGLPGQKRIIRPAVFEGPDNDFLNGEMMGDTYVQVQTYQAGQQLYAPALATVADRITIGPEIMDRLTIVLDRDGYVQEVSCG
jgi:hypothetical protein